ncbi:hypothetical protein L6Q96_11995 [Candidatus Binatia bacterium]|nr:hypothetical protein [Candidatus Binatia bacterium]
MCYVCPKCRETYTVQPPGGTCTNCGATLVPDVESREAEQRGEPEGVFSPRRRL